MIPEKLWNKNRLYHPEKLIEVYRTQLIELDLYEYAKSHENQTDGATGGKDKEETYKHFSERFLASAIRVQFVLLNPRGEFTQISNDLKVTFGSGKISILDIPSGTGAGILSLLCNIAKLRINSKIPRLPLEVNILAGDYSNSALSIYGGLLEKMKKNFENELMFINYDTFEWNASDPRSTNLLVKKWLKNEDSFEEFYVLMSAFSGVGKSNYETFEESFKFIQTSISHLHGTSTYIEPVTNVSNSFLKWVTKRIDKLVTWLNIKEGSTEEDRFYWYDAIRENAKAKSSVRVKLYGR